MHGDTTKSIIRKDPVRKMVKMRIELDNGSIEVHVQYGKRKKLSIEIDQVGLVIVKAPKGTGEERIGSAVQQHGQWILERRQLLAKALEGPKAKAYEGQGKFFHLGKEYNLHELIDTCGQDEEQLKISLKKFYFASCKKVIQERIAIYQTQLKVRPKSFDIVESRTKWGSCSSDKKLTFNYRLAMAPVEVIDYVVIHELCHLLHMNHDRSFWRRVGSIMPDYKRKEEYLARYGAMLTM